MTNGKKTYFCFPKCKIKFKAKSGVVSMFWGNQVYHCILTNQSGK